MNCPDWFISRFEKRDDSRLACRLPAITNTDSPVSITNIFANWKPYNRKGLKGCVRGLWQTNLCKNIKKLILLPYPFYFKLTKTSKTFQTTFLFLLDRIIMSLAVSTFNWKYIFKGCNTFLYLCIYIFICIFQSISITFHYPGHVSDLQPWTI